MFRLHKTLDVITLFHKPSLPSSTRVLNILRMASAAASETTTMDQASDQTNTIDNRRGEFQLDVTEAPPTPDQMRNILDYLAAKGVKPSAVVPGARNAEDAIKRVKESDANGIVRPIVVDWVNGKAVVGDNESEILKLVRLSENA
ncbi:hypothetical protein VTN49DRAFT_3606 [Thermomyces lanuginosus]|uniref:uncharacterized protein n=1 Tax=Thermomyces lanuginosus TaxID=5541 RepID=UPI0037449886